MKTRTVTSRGFTLLEVMVAMAILATALVALSEIDAGAIAMHAYAKKLNVATMLARQKMLDVETQLDEKGLPAEGENISPDEGNFDEQGFPEYKWKVEVVAPKAENLDPQKLISTILGDTGSDSSSGSGPTRPDPASAGGGLSSMLGSLTGLGSSSPSSGGPSTSPLSGLGGIAASAMGAPAQMMITQITQMVREVRLTVTWMDGKNPQEFTVVEQIVSMGPNNLQSAQGATTQKNQNLNPLDE